MATIGPSTIFDQSVGGMLRLRGNLAVGAVLATGNVYRERIRMPSNAVYAEVRAKLTGVAGVPTLQLVPQTANIQTNDLTVSDATSGQATSNALGAASSLSNGVEAITVYRPKGETFVDVVVDCSGVGALGTVAYCDVGVRVTGDVAQEEALMLQELRIMNQLLIQGLNIPVDPESEYNKDPAYRP